MTMRVFYLTDFLKDDIESAFRECFAAAQKAGTPVKIVIAPGEYTFAPQTPIGLFSGLTVEAEGARFIWQQHWTGPVHRIMFYGENICNFTWDGGRFEGYVYDVPPAVSTWAPECCARCIVIETTPGGKTENLCFRNIEGENCSGSVVSVYGAMWHPEKTRARNIEVCSCRFKRCGKFMWDYGYLWEKLVFADLFTPAEVALGERYAAPEHRSGEVRFYGDHICVEKMPPFKKEERHPFDTIAFYGENLPPEIRRGKCYFILDMEDGKITFSDIPGGEPSGHLRHCMAGCIFSAIFSACFIGDMLRQIRDRARGVWISPAAAISRFATANWVQTGMPCTFIPRRMSSSAGM